MAKISVRHCVAQAYGLVFGQPFTLIGLTWLPAVFYAVAASYLIERMGAAMAVAVPSAGGVLGQYAFFYMVLLVLATALFGAAIAVPLTRQAFGLREERAAVHLVIGAREVRLFLALTRYYALTLAVLIVFAIGAGIAITQGETYAAAHGLARDWLGVPLQTWLNSVAASAAVLLFLFFTVRFGFLLDAIAAAEDHAKLARARALSQNNFWRIAVTLFIVTVPAGLVGIAFAMTFGGLAWGGHSISVANADTMNFAAILAVTLVVLHGLVAGASAAAYGEMAEAAAQANEPIEVVNSQQPAMAFAKMAATPDVQPLPGIAYGASPEAEALTGLPPMGVATAETQGGATTESGPATIIEWMPPPPDAHFGSDPHDALHHPSDGANAVEPLAEAVRLAEQAPPAEAQDVSSVEAAPLRQDVTGAAGIAVPEMEIAVPEAMPSEGAAVASPSSEIPEHAHNAEFPVPPMPPVLEDMHTPG